MGPSTDIRNACNWFLRKALLRFSFFNCTRFFSSISFFSHTSFVIRILWDPLGIL
jgi:hypothetical protein